MEAAILELLGQYPSLGYERIAALLGAAPAEVRTTLEALRERGVVTALPIGVMEGDHIRQSSFWRLTDAGREELAG